MQKQLFGLVEHLFVEYSVPPCLYRACLQGEAPFHSAHPMYRQWLVTIGQGGSFARIAKPHLTSREAHVFLIAPTDNRIHENVWWAKLTAAGASEEAVRELIRRIYTYYFFDDHDGRLAEMTQFFGRYCAEIEPAEFGEMVDCAAWLHRHEPGFRMKGRTPGSMAKISKEWHAAMQRMNIRSLVTWPGLQISAWREYRNDMLWEVSELRTNIEVLREGRAQRNCVFAYVPPCRSGKSSIFSLRGFVEPTYQKEVSRVTIEVDEKRRIVQARGYRNCQPTEEERGVMRGWARSKGIWIDG